MFLCTEPPRFTNSMRGKKNSRTQRVMHISRTQWTIWSWRYTELNETCEHHTFSEENLRESRTQWAIWTWRYTELNETCEHHTLSELWENHEVNTSSKYDERTDVERTRASHELNNSRTQWVTNSMSQVHMTNPWMLREPARATNSMRQNKNQWVM